MGGNISRRILSLRNHREYQRGFFGLGGQQRPLAPGGMTLVFGFLPPLFKEGALGLSMQCLLCAAAFAFAQFCNWGGPEGSEAARAGEKK